MLVLRPRAAPGPGSLFDPPPIGAVHGGLWISPQPHPPPARPVARRREGTPEPADLILTASISMMLTASPSLIRGLLPRTLSLSSVPSGLGFEGVVLRGLIHRHGAVPPAEDNAEIRPQPFAPTPATGWPTCVLGRRTGGPSQDLQTAQDREFFEALIRASVVHRPREKADLAECESSPEFAWSWPPWTRASASLYFP